MIQPYKLKKILLWMVLLGGVLVPFQNCSMYKSDGRKEFEQDLQSAAGPTCLPYIDVNAVASAIGATQGLYVDRTEDRVSGATYCSFTAAGSTSEITMVVCDISSYNRDTALLAPALIANPTGASQILLDAGLHSGNFREYFGRQTLIPPVVGFVDANSFGWAFTNTQNTGSLADDEVGVRYYAAETTDTLGVACTVMVALNTYNSTANKIDTYVKPLQRIVETMANNSN